MVEKPFFCNFVCFYGSAKNEVLLMVKFVKQLIVNQINNDRSTAKKTNTTLFLKNN